jgi:hypothetical protein
VPNFSVMHLAKEIAWRILELPLLRWALLFLHSHHLLEMCFSSLSQIRDAPPSAYTVEEARTPHGVMPGAVAGPDAARMVHNKVAEEKVLRV